MFLWGISSTFAGLFRWCWAARCPPSYCWQLVFSLKVNQWSRIGRSDQRLCFMCSRLALIRDWCCFLPHGLLAIAGDFWWDMFISWRFLKVFEADLAFFQMSCNLMLLLQHDSIHLSNQISLLPNIDQFKLTFVNYITILYLKRRFKTFISLILLGDAHFLIS